jgi:phosphoribosylamine--glycine ligase
VFALTDGRHALPLAAARDQRVGTVTPARRPLHGSVLAGAAVRSARGRGAVEQVHRPVLDELARRGTPFIGLLYAGLMLTDEAARARVQLSLRRS